MARNSTERLGGEYNLESRGSAFSCTPGVNTALPSICKCGITLVLKGVVFLRDHLYCCNSYMDESNGIRKFAPLNLAHSCRYLQRVLVQGGLSPRTRA